MKTATMLSELGQEASNKGCNYGEIWDACCGPIYRIIDEEGNNVADAQIRHLAGDHWITVDDTDGYRIVDGNRMGWLNLELAD